MRLPNYYQTLGVARGETPENIKKAYRKLARRYHPDISREKDAERRMKEINEAYDILSDSQKRAEYEAALDAAARGHGGETSFGAQEERRFYGFGGHSGFQRRRSGRNSFQDFGGFDLIDDLFEHMFELLGAGFPFHDGGNTTCAVIELDLEDAFTGADREIAVRVPYRDSAGRSRSRQRRFKVHIPPGVSEGSDIRLAGQGSRGAVNATGDLLLRVKFRPHPKMRAINRDVYMELALAPWEAALGAIVQVQLPKGPVRVRVPKGVRQGCHLTVAGRGVPGSPPGDLILEANIVLPPADTASSERAYQEFARQTAFNPRF